MKIKLSELSQALKDAIKDYESKGLIKSKHITNAQDERIPDIEYDFVSNLTLTYFLSDVTEILLKKELNNEKVK